jgi:hypothetical protein
MAILPNITPSSTITTAQLTQFFVRMRFIFFILLIKLASEEQVM